MSILDESLCILSCYTPFITYNIQSSRRDITRHKTVYFYLLIIIVGDNNKKCFHVPNSNNDNK